MKKNLNYKFILCFIGLISTLLPFFSYIYSSGINTKGSPYTLNINSVASDVPLDFGEYISLGYYGGLHLKGVKYNYTSSNINVSIDFLAISDSSIGDFYDQNEDFSLFYDLYQSDYIVLSKDEVSVQDRTWENPYWGKGTGEVGYYFIFLNADEDMLSTNFSYSFEDVYETPRGIPSYDIPLLLGSSVITCITIIFTIMREKRKNHSK